MIILDLNQVLFSNMHMMKELDEGLFRHMALNTIRNINSRFRHEYGEMVIASDSYKYWRRDYFPYYKAHRKRDREESNIDWKTVFDYFKKIKMELQTNFPYKFIEVESAEADDVIAVLVRYVDDDRILVVSSDKDYQQLQSDYRVDQYDPMRNKFVKCEDPIGYLEDHIFTGDRGDGIPNILSDDDTFVAGKRQKALTDKQRLMLDNVELPDHPSHRNFIRNSTLIDFEHIPDHLASAIIDKYEETIPAKRNKLLSYFVKNRLQLLSEKINDF